MNDDASYKYEDSEKTATFWNVFVEQTAMRIINTIVNNKYILSQENIMKALLFSNFTLPYFPRPLSVPKTIDIIVLSDLLPFSVADEVEVT